MMRRTAIHLVLMACVAMLLLGASPSHAREIMQGDDCTVPADVTLQGTLFVFCEVLNVQGRIEGNIIGFALRARIDGVVEGDVYLTGGQLAIRGEVQSNVHYGGAVLRVMSPEEDATPLTEEATGRIRGDLFSVTLSTRLDPLTQLMGEAIGFGYQFINEGTIERDVNFWGSAMHVRGRIHGDIYADVGDPNLDGGQIETLLLPFQFDLNLEGGGMNVIRGAVVRGALHYTAPVIGIVEGRVIEGVHFTEVATVVLPTLEEPRTLAIYFDQFIREATTLISIGLLLIFVAPSVVQQPLNMMRSRPVPSVIVGMLSFIISFPIVLILLVMSALVLVTLEVLGLRGVTIAASVVLGLLNIGGISLFYFVAIFVARTLVGLALGRVLLRLLVSDAPLAQRMSVQIIVGTLVLALAASLPIIGWIFNALALFLGLGAVLTIILDKFRLMREGTPNIAPYATRPGVERRPRPIMPNIPIVPPVVTTPATPPALPSAGMDNLPSGFDPEWFFKDTS